MKTIATVATLLAITGAAFGQDPNGNRMNEPYPEVRLQDNLGHAPGGAPPPDANRMNVDYSKVPGSELSGGPNPDENRLNAEWAQPESKAQAGKPGKAKRQ